MNSMFTDAQLNFGKVLVLNKNSKIKISEITTKIRATSIKPLRASRRKIEAANILISDLQYAFWYTNGYVKHLELKIYSVGGNVASTFLALAHENDFVAAITLDPTDVKKLHNNVVILGKLSQTANVMNSALVHATELQAMMSANKDDVTKVQACKVILESSIADLRSDLHIYNDRLEQTISSKW